MSDRRYTVTMSWGETWILLADLAEASAPLRHVDDDGSVYFTPFQTADACHGQHRAAELIAGWWDNESGYLGDDGSVDDVEPVDEEEEEEEEVSA